MASLTTRRRFLAISAAAGGLGLVPFAAPARSAAAHLVEWRGRSFGAVATIRIHHTDRQAAERLLARVVREAQRLEDILSLYRQDSVLCELNRRGVLVAPPAELLDVLDACEHIWRLTGGVFDPTVQPLWTCYAAHFSKPGASADGPDPAEIEAARRAVGWAKVSFDRDRIVFRTPGVALTLNGIAQGFLTDCVVTLLREAGIESCLADMGEIRTLGRHPDGAPWKVGLDGPSPRLMTIGVVDKAVATSGAAGFRFDDEGRCNHLFNPATGRCADPARAVSVVAKSAAEADALSTAFALMEEREISRVLAQVGDVRAFLNTAQGTREIAGRDG